MDDRQNLSQLASVITLPESNRPARIYRKTVALPTMLSGTEIVYVDRVETKWALRVHLQAGSRVPLHATASGKLLMSLLPKAQRERLLRTLPLAMISQQSITDRAALGKELEQTRRRKIGINNQENLQGIIAVAVPIMLDRNRACAAVAVQAPISRMSLEQLLAYVPTMNEAALRLKETFTTDNKVPTRSRV